ncbi:hypothetical protein NN3_31730 [Nocardia neocaledoniensis NBRC 108232]|uniref:TetR family transcriptional regulator n=2 Tax=Nocardia neocaledoniensis TaxID=236511 RepID=A0A317P2B6_9NOCA|nr:TetR family transcriptional regulator [Nocardia neocaledoniensis]GEM32166.1 hypothetical protein NN3_31730 [Nocardia neocaledoniensis NBRC 108232]
MSGPLGEISSRAGVSKAAVFRHFDSRMDLVAAAGEVSRRHLAVVTELRVPESITHPVGLATLMHLIRKQIRSDINTVWLELLVAARTEPELFPVARGIITFAATRCCHRRRRVRRR